MNEQLEPGDRVLEPRAVAGAGGMFAGLVAAPVAAIFSSWWWPWCVLAAVVGAGAGFLLATIVGRLVFPIPTGETVVMRVGPSALGIALRASVAGGFMVNLACAAVATVGGSGVAAAVTLSVGFGVSVVVGGLAALL